MKDRRVNFERIQRENIKDKVHEQTSRKSSRHERDEQDTNQNKEDRKLKNPTSQVRE